MGGLLGLGPEFRRAGLDLGGLCLSPGVLALVFDFRRACWKAYQGRRNVLLDDPLRTPECDYAAAPNRTRPRESLPASSATRASRAVA